MKKKHNRRFIYYATLIIAIFAVLLVTIALYEYVLLNPVKFIVIDIIIIIFSQIVAQLFVKIKWTSIEKTINEMDVATIQMRHEFSANVSHELKTPLTAIRGYAEIIEQGVDDEEERRKFAEKIRKEAGRLLSLINDIIRISELDESDSETRFTKVNLITVINDCIEMLQQNAEINEVTLYLEKVPEGDLTIKGDETMIRELVYNLVDNAIRYNKAGGQVHVGVLKEANKISVFVKDTGIGIPDKYQDRIFERFFRVDKSRSKKTGGTGLGLSIVKHIAMVHKADIKVESYENKGTTITVSF